MKIRKAVIPVAGLGTRFMPYTKAVPKEMLPILDIPSIHFIIEEAINSGITDICFVTSPGKASIKDYFEKNVMFEELFSQPGKEHILAQYNRIPSGFKSRFVTQKEARGLGDAILHAEEFVGRESFAVFLPDDIVFSRKPVMLQMMDTFEKYKKHVIGVEAVERKMISSYGIIKPKKIADRVYEITDMAEKPPLKTAFSNLGIVGRYILPASVFGHIKSTKPGAKGEIQLTDALHRVMETEGLLALEFKGDRCDTGDKYGYLVAIMKYAAMQKGIKPRLVRDIKKIFKL
jgi:UTP--glucose-1-phosphate uridylyltransferase